MTAYIVRRVLWGIALLVIVCALTFVLFRVFPTGNPAVLRAGRDPNPRLIVEIERVLGLNKPLIVQFWDYLKNVLLHFDLGYSYYSGESVRSLIAERLPATISLTVGAAVLWMVGGLGSRDPLGAAAALAARSRRDGHGARARLGTRILARAGRAVPVRAGHRQVEDLSRRGQLRPDHERSVEVVHVVDHAVVRAGLRRRGGVRAPHARQPDRDDGRGLHQDRPRQGPARAQGRSPRSALVDQPDSHPPGS